MLAKDRELDEVHQRLRQKVNGVKYCIIPVTDVRIQENELVEAGDKARQQLRKKVNNGKCVCTLSHV